MDINITDTFLDNILSITPDKIRSETYQKTRYCLLDYLGVTFLGAKLQKDKIEVLTNYLESNGKDGLPIGLDKQYNLTFSIFCNGLNSHYLELDDGCRFGVTHPGAPLFSALLPVAKKYNVGWSDFLMGVILGYETTIRISSAIQPYHYRKGYHPTATCDPLGITVGIGTMLNLNKSIIKDAFSCACISAGGSLKAIENTSKLKVFNAARAAKLGYVSVAMALAGFTGPNDALAGSTGFLNMMAECANDEYLNRKLTDDLFINKVYCKLYSSCRHTHGAIEGVIKLKNQYSILPSEVSKIQIRIYKGIKGKHDIYEIVSEESAKMSIPYSCAVALILGNGNLESFQEPNLHNHKILEMKDKVEIIEDEYISNLLPQQRSTKVIIMLKDGTEYTIMIDHPKGEPENPVGEDEFIDKFVNLSLKSGRSETNITSIIQEVLNSSCEMTQLFELIR